MYSNILQYKLFLNFHFINIMVLYMAIINEKPIKCFSVQGFIIDNENTFFIKGCQITN